MCVFLFNQLELKLEVKHFLAHAVQNMALKECMVSRPYIALSCLSSTFLHAIFFHIFHIALVEMLWLTHIPPLYTFLIVMALTLCM